jgi:geranyl-CoA carboxylase alpha subunit
MSLFNKPRFTSLLVANRGEIAVRIIKTAKTLGLRTIAVYSEADVAAPHVHLADEAVCIGPAPAGESYLVAENVIAAARESGAEAIHPGYGFLSENADFAAAVEAAGLIFIGPSPKAIELMGNKAAAKRRMIAAGVPCVPGYEGEDQSDKTLIAEGVKIGFPIMVKAAAGGGGRGMRLVEEADDLPNAIESARSEALNAFGSGELILEKAIMRPRHVELQVFADTQGDTIHLGERDCSVQRRHQKIVEEAPCPIMTEALRDRMGVAAIEAAKSIHYRGAGTVEFLLDPSGDFYFLEMNTRLQVEHPVTEMITGLDLVALQIKVAQGDELGLTQEDVQLKGHAIEVRLYAEDPTQDFLPQTGSVDIWRPATGEGVRIDAGIRAGSDISPFYDPMIAKMIAWGETREIANARLLKTLKDSRLFGTVTNKSFLVDVLAKQSFKEGQATTAFISEEFGDGALVAQPLSLREAAIAAVIDYEARRDDAHKASLGVNTELLNWTSSGHLASNYRYGTHDIIDLELVARGQGHYEAKSGETALSLELLYADDGEARLSVEGARVSVGYLVKTAGEIHIDVEGRTYSLRNELAVSGIGEEAGGGGRVIAPMHGTLLELIVSVGEHVEKGTRLAVLEAMKMQHDILAEISGTVTEVSGAAGTQIGADDLILTIEPDEDVSA